MVKHLEREQGKVTGVRCRALGGGYWIVLVPGTRYPRPDPDTPISPYLESKNSEKFQNY